MEQAYNLSTASASRASPLVMMRIQLEQSCLLRNQLKFNSLCAH